MSKSKKKNENQLELISDINPVQLLPCVHLESVTNQLESTKDLLKNLHTIHPEILIEHSIDPDAYINSMLFRSAIESLRGSFIASSTKEREAIVKGYLEKLMLQRKILDFEYTASENRCDFNVIVEEGYIAALEIKGGEGNSINISEKPENANEFIVWSHLDGAIVNQPSHGAHAVIGRLLNEMTDRGKHIDALFIRDKLCGTKLRPCPKYSTSQNEISPDIFLFPQFLPTIQNPTPPVHTLSTLRLPKLILELFNVDEASFDDHVWEVHVEFMQSERNKVKSKRKSQIFHKGIQVDQGKSRRR